MTTPSHIDRKAMSVALARNAWVMAQNCTDERMKRSLLQMAGHWATRARLQDSIGSALRPESLTGGASANVSALHARYGQGEGSPLLAWHEKKRLFR